MKKALLIDPYFDTLGGGERYMLGVGLGLVKAGYEVWVNGFSEEWRGKAEERFGLKLAKINFLTEDLLSLIRQERKKAMRDYELSFCLTDGSLPFLFAKRNFIHFQVPFKGVNKKPLLNKVKLSLVEKVVCNSHFTKKVIDQEFGVKSDVLYPPVAVGDFKPAQKEKIILYAGRFTDLLHHKRQDVLIDAFSDLLKKKQARGWRLVLAGSDREGKALVANLKRRVGKLPIEIKTNLTFEELKKEYGRASLFWVAAGFGVEERLNPMAVEHFGMTTVEAMAAGAVPLVINKGGQKEIVVDGVNGFVWDSVDQLVEKTLNLIQNPDKIETLSKKAVVSAKTFGEKDFYEELEKIIK